MLDFRLARPRGETEIIRASGPSLDRRFVVAALGRRATANARGQQRRAPSRARRCALVWLLVSAVAALGTAGALAAAGHKHASVHKSTTAKHNKHGAASDKGRRGAQRRGGAQEDAQRIPLPRERPPTDQPAAADSAVTPMPPDVAAAKRAIGLVRQGKSAEATALAASF